MVNSQGVSWRADVPTRFGSYWAFDSTKPFNERCCITLMSVEDTTASCGFFSCFSIGHDESKPAKETEELTSDVIDTLARAISILEKEMEGGASMMKLQKAGSVIEALKVIVQASSIDSADATKLTAWVQKVDSAKSEQCPTQ